MNAKHAVLLSLIAGLCACGSQEDPPAEAPMAVEDTVVGDTVGTLDRARGVEATTLEHKQRLDEQLEADGG